MRTVRPYRAPRQRPAAGATRRSVLRDLTRPHGGVYPIYDDSYATATVVVDEPRQPSIVPIGVLNAEGFMLCRVTLPVRVPMGFHRTWDDDWDDEVCAILPENMIRVSNAGVGVSDISTDELDEYEDDDDAEG